MSVGCACINTYPLTSGLLLRFAGLLLRHWRPLRQYYFPFSFLLGKDPKESIFPAEWAALVLAINRDVFGQYSNISSAVKLHVHFASVQHFEGAVRSLQIFKLLSLVE